MADRPAGQGGLGPAGKARASGALVTVNRRVQPMDLRIFVFGPIFALAILDRQQPALRAWLARWGLLPETVTTGRLNQRFIQVGP